MLLFPRTQLDCRRLPHKVKLSPGNLLVPKSSVFSQISQNRSRCKIMDKLCNKFLHSRKRWRYVEWISDSSLFWFSKKDKFVVCLLMYSYHFSVWGFSATTQHEGNPMDGINTKPRFLGGYLRLRGSNTIHTNYIHQILIYLYTWYIISGYLHEVLSVIV